MHNSPNAELNMIKIVVAEISDCLGSAFVGLTDALALARHAIAHATGEDASFDMLTAVQTARLSLSGSDARSRSLRRSMKSLPATPFSSEAFSRTS